MSFNDDDTTEAHERHGELVVERAALQERLIQLRAKRAGK